MKRIELDVKKLGIKNKELEEKLILVIEGFNESYEEQEKEQEFVNKLRRVWNGMKTRCYNPDALAYKNYGGRGIYICERWKDNFENFFDDMWRGYKDGLQIDRINNDGPYSPDNCRWVTPSEKEIMVFDEFNIHPEKESERKILDWERCYFLTKYYCI